MYQSHGPVGPKPSPPPAHQRVEEKWSREGVEAKDCQTQSPGDLLWEHEPTLHGALVIRGVGKLRQGEYLERLRFQQLVENIYPQPAALGQKKGG